jgi:hypothetical protein
VREALTGLEASLVAVLPGSVEQLRLFRDELELDTPLLSDPAWELHHAYGLGRGNRRAIFASTSTWLAYARLLHKVRLRRPTQDVMQLGGTAVVGGDGNLGWLYRSRNPSDYAPPDEVALRVDRLGSATPDR